MNKSDESKRKQLEYSSAREKQRFGIRKFSVGAASVLLGTTLFWLFVKSCV